MKAGSFVPLIRRAALASTTAIDVVERCVSREFEFVQQELDYDYRLMVDVNRKVHTL
jgi:hypothetical protein